MATALMTLREARLGFGEKELFRGVSLAVQPGDRIALLGRNGSGKSTLLKVMAGRIEADGGDRFIKPGARAAYLAQDLPRVPGLTVAGYIAEGLEEGDVAADDYRVRRLLDAVSLDGGTELLTLSGGESRRAAIARALIGEPDLLFLDEPTNHLDLPTIEWLEGELARSRAATVIVSHDRAFLARLTRRTYWLEDGTLRVNEAGFNTFEAWSEKLREEEAQSLARLAKEIEVEERWLARGVTARRRRNQGRLRRLHDLRRERQERTRSDKAAALDLETGKASGALVIEATDLVKRFKRDGETTTIVDGFSTRIMRGDRVGVIGPNGAGKTTLLRLLLGEIAPDSGTVRHGTRLEIVHIDQRRDQLDPEATLWESLAPGGGDSVMVHGRPIHVVAYLKQFLFQEAQARSPVRSLSGGEKNRLLLAILLARPCNLLVLDEPTNDLDLETLELLEEQLADFDGTVLIVSHDRAFLDRTVSSLIAVEGEGEIAEYVGGYEDYQRERSRTARREPAGRKAAAAGSPPAEKGQKAPARRSGLSYKDKREYEGLPARIAALEAEIARQEKALADPTLYGRDPDRFHKLAGALDAARAELAAAEERWLELEILKDELQGS